MMTEQPKNTSLINNIISELNNVNVPQKLLLPYVEYIKSAVRPYYTLHIILQITIILLLVFLVFKCKKL